MVIGVICGFVIPKIVIGIVEDQACVDSATDSNYEDWAKEKTNSIITKLYYWDITNKEDFLYNGKLPKLRERGPYVYKQATQEINVNFSSKTRSSKRWKKQAKFFKEESCKDCEEDDQITVLNMGYLGLMNAYESDEAFALFHLPNTISSILKQFKNCYETLGNSVTVWQDPLKSTWTDPGFGAWINMNFTREQMKGLYGVLGNRGLLFGETVTNTTLKAECKLNPAQTKCGFVVQMKAAAMLNQTAHNNEYRALLQMINKTLCPNSSIQCFNNTGLFLNISSYVEHVNKYTMWVLLGERFEIVTTMPQKNLTLGYTMEKVIDPKTGKPIFVPGMVEAHKNLEDAEKNAKVSTFHTCEDKEQKYQWAAYDGKKNISITPDMKAKDSEVHGYLFIVPRSETADKPCIFSHELPFKQTEIFVSVIAMKLKVRYESETSLHGLELKRFTPTKDDYLNHSAVRQGFIDFSFKTKAPSFLSFAHLLYANLTAPTSFTQIHDKEKHQSIIDIEAVTGLILRAYLRLQLNAPILKDFVKVPRIKGPLNISYVSEANETLYLKSIPVQWGEYGSEASEDIVNSIKQKVIGTLGLACGVLIGLPVLGCIFIIVATVLFVIHRKANQISEISK
mgnify:CR=1 FL=1